MKHLLIAALFATVAYADHQPSIELAWTSYGRQEVDHDRLYHVALDRFQWRLADQWRGGGNTLEGAIRYDRIHVDQRFEGHDPPFGLFVQTLYQLPLELRWIHAWSRRWSTMALVIPAIVGEDEEYAINFDNRYTLWGGFAIMRDGIGIGLAHLEVSGHPRWWPVLAIHRQWRRVRLDGVFPRRLDAHLGMITLRAALEGVKYEISYTSPSLAESLQPLYFSQLHLGAGLVFRGSHRLSMVFEGGWVTRRRFEGPVAGAKGREIGQEWYLRPAIRWGVECEVDPNVKTTKGEK